MPRPLSSMLLVSQSAHVLVSRSMFARQHGWAVVEANSARSAHEQIEERPFTALFLDGSLPEAAAQAVSTAFHESNPEATVYAFQVVGRDTRVSPFQDSRMVDESFHSALATARPHAGIEAENLLPDADLSPLRGGE
jgi:response regulator RpfG family c-di-GMP phosphodiesterase